MFPHTWLNVLGLLLWLMGTMEQKLYHNERALIIFFFFFLSLNYVTKFHLFCVNLTYEVLQMSQYHH